MATSPILAAPLVGASPNNLAATRAPAATDDSTQGYNSGSLWVNATMGMIWRCLSASPGKARWAGMDAADHPGQIAGKVYPVVPAIVGAASAAFVADTLYLFPVLPDSATPWQSLGLRATVAGGAGAALKFGVWDIDLSVVEPRGLPLAWHNAGTPATGTGNLMGQLTSADGAGWAPIPGHAYAAGVLLAAASPLPSVMSLGNGTPTLSYLAGGGIGNSPAGTPQVWTPAVAYATDLSTLNIAAVSTSGGVAPYLLYGT